MKTKEQKFLFIRKCKLKEKNVYAFKTIKEYLKNNILEVNLP